MGTRLLPAKPPLAFFVPTVKLYWVSEEHHSLNVEFKAQSADTRVSPDSSWLTGKDVANAGYRRLGFTRHLLAY